MLARLVAVTLVATAIGCTTLGKPQGVVAKAVAPTAAVAIATPVGTSQATAPEPTATAAAAEEPLGPFPRPNEQQAMQQVLPALQQLAATDPELHSQVLEQLATSDPSLWSLTVQRAQTTAAFKQQLAGTSTPASPAAASTPLPTTPATTPSQVVPASATIENPLAQQQVAPASAQTPVVSLAPPVQKNLPQVVGQAGPTGQWIENSHFASPETTTQSEAPRFEPPATTTVSIRPASLETDAEPVETRLEPFDGPRDWRAALEETIALLEEATPDRPRSTAEKNEFVRLRLLQLVAGRTDEAVDAPRGLSSAEQGYWSNQIYALSTLLDDERFSDRLRRIAAAARYQSEASDKLSGLGDLQIRNFVTCAEVYGFGAYEPRPDARYRAGEQVVLYAEIENYKSEATSDGHRTSLASHYRLVGEDGVEAAGADFPVVDDLCLTRRRDFHIQYAITLPKGIQPGEYRLELSVTDQLGDKIGHSDLMVSIAGR